MMRHSKIAALLSLVGLAGAAGAVQDLPGGPAVRQLNLTSAATRIAVEQSWLHWFMLITCIVIFLFGAPLATSTQRGGAAYGIGVSLGTTVIFLMLIQLMKAVGGKGLIPPEIAAWVPSLIFAVVGSYLLSRVRT